MKEKVSVVLMFSSQLQIRFKLSWKLYQNLCSERLLKPSLKLVISLIHLGL